MTAGRVATAGRPAGYSGTPLIAKLGVKSGMRALFIGAPAGFDRTLGPLPEGVSMLRSASARDLDIVLFFTLSASALAKRLPSLRKAIRTNGMIWIAWPKKASGVVTDVTEDVVRRHALAAGLVDVKVCAIDETWSGLKLMYRLKDRGG